MEAFESVWDAIEDDPKEATKLKVSSELMIQITRLIEENRCSLEEAASRFQPTPEKIDHVLAGRIYCFQAGELFEMVAALGHRVRVEIEAA